MAPLVINKAVLFDRRTASVRCRATGTREQTTGTGTKRVVAVKKDEKGKFVDGGKFNNLTPQKKKKFEKAGLPPYKDRGEIIWKGDGPIKYPINTKTGSSPIIFQAAVLAGGIAIIGVVQPALLALNTSVLGQ